MNLLRRLAVTALVATAVLQTGCVTTLTPKTAELQRVHEAYTDEFTAVAAPLPGSELKSHEPEPGDRFARTLRGIHEYRLKYPADTQELAHLNVLEGMIYLQSGRFGLAAAMKDTVVDAGTKLGSAKGTTVRDQIFAQNFETLLEGWSETRKDNNRNWQTFERVANQLAAEINRIPATQRANVETDQGALYVATSSAIFYVWAAQQITMSRDRESAPEKKKEWYRKGRDLIGQFLSDVEKTPGVSKDLGAMPQGRLRYVQWYHWLNDQTEPPV
jgi:hypothetical protein